jgi:hypothetical protein
MISELDAGIVADRVKPRMSAINKCCDYVIRSVEYSLKGYLYEAFELLDKAVREVLDELKRMEAQWDTDERLLYRVRRTSTPMLQREELFHIPFEKRHEVPQHRYSIPGLPCLYLSGSLYTCWEEMGRPPFHELQVSAFWRKKQINMLHLNVIPSELLRWVTANDIVEPPNPSITKPFLEGWIYCGLVLWPLIASSSIIVRHRDSPFKPEYLVPQMLLQWVRRNGDFDGICYSSTNVQVTSPEYPLAVCNYVFPATVIKPVGRCENLCSLFKMTKPYGWQLLRAAQVGDRVSNVAAAWFRIELIEGLEEQYADSEFGEIEAKLRKLADMTKKKNESGEPDVGDIRSEGKI